MSTDLSSISDRGGRELATRLETLILAVDGVDRLQPTLRRAVASVGADAVRRATPAVARLLRPGTPGLDVRPGQDGAVDVTADLSTRPGSSALEIGRAVRRVVRDALVAAGERPGRIAITVLDVVPDQPEAELPDAGVTGQ